MNVLCRYFTAMRLTFLVASICFGGLCLASNSKDAPGKPTNLQVRSVHDLKINLTWTKPLTTVGTPVSSSLLYRVSYTVQGSGNQQITRTVSTESIQLGLNANTRYNIHVKAIRSDDQKIQGDWSETLTVDSKEFVPAKPTNLRVTYASGLKVTVAWDEPLTTVSGIPDASSLIYIISYRNLESRTTRQIRSSKNEQSAGLTLSGNSRYAIKVKAYKTFNALVYGPWSDILSHKTNESAPSMPPTNVKVVSKTPSSITVSWGSIPVNGRNGIIQGYVVFYKQGASSWSERDVKLANFQELTNLATGKQYYVSVAGYTRVGRGRKSRAKPVIVGGQFITTTKQTITQKPTTQKSTRTTKQTTKPSTKSSTLAITTAALQTPQRPSTVHVDTLPSVSTKEQLKTTGVAFSQDPNKRTSTDSKSARKTSTETENTPAVALASKADENSNSGFFNKILMIGAPAAGVLLLMIILIAVFVSVRRRSRRRRQQLNGGIPLQKIETGRRNRSRDAVTRGASSIRYEPPQHNLAEDSLTERLLSDETDPVTVVVHEPNGSLPADNYPEKCGLSVDLNTEQRKLTESRTSGLYDSIGSLDKGGWKNTAKRDTGERYVTQDQMAASCEKCPLVLPDQTSHRENGQFERSNRVETNATPQGNIYENMQDSEHLYETLGLEGKEDPLYENTRASANSRESNRDKDAGYEPIPFI